MDGGHLGNHGMYDGTWEVIFTTANVYGLQIQSLEYWSWMINRAGAWPLDLVNTGKVISIYSQSFGDTPGSNAFHATDYPTTQLH